MPHTITLNQILTLTLSTWSSERALRKSLRAKASKPALRCILEQGPISAGGAVPIGTRASCLRRLASTSAARPKKVAASSKLPICYDRESFWLYISVSSVQVH